MKRFHVHVRVKDLEESIRFYADYFGAAPSVREPDYAKWMLDDPRVNFAISERCGGRLGVDHLGVQVDDDTELSEIAGRLAACNRAVVEERGAHCCYAYSDKAWATDPQGVKWEAFRSDAAIALRDSEMPAAMGGTACDSACCGS